MLRQSAAWLAARDGLPTSMQAVVGYYAETGVFDARSLQLRRRVDSVTDRIMADAFGAVENALEAEFGVETLSFEYDTKLVLPAELTLGYLYRRLDADRHDDAEAMTRLAIEALLDGDMRDAINDAEFEDFTVDFQTSEADRRRVAETAQATLEARVDELFEAYPDAVRAAYDSVVAISEAHQDEDDRFRELLAAATGERPESRLDPDEARARIREEYTFATFDDPPDLFTEAERELPYFKTQYDRVGVIYEGMLDMYRAAGFPIEDAFSKSIVLAIIGAQVWLDDVDDYRADMREGQLTPVTAEYVRMDSEQAAYDATVELATQYLDRAEHYARQADSTLTGIAAEYIYRSGSPAALPH